MSAKDDNSEYGWETATIQHAPCREFTLDGVLFSWWSIGTDPALVTISNATYGAKSNLTQDDLEAFARKMAAELLEQSRERGRSR